MRTAAQAGEALKAADINGNVYSEFAKKVKLGGSIRTRAEYTNGFYNAVRGFAYLLLAGRLVLLQA